MVSEEWRSMEEDERSKWEEKARMDRDRFEQEKMHYRGPWTVSIGDRKSKVSQSRKHLRDRYSASSPPFFSLAFERSICRIKPHPNDQLLPFFHSLIAGALL
jgi:hypothetical protein